MPVYSKMDYIATSLPKESREDGAMPVGLQAIAADGFRIEPDTDPVVRPGWDSLTPGLGSSRGDFAGMSDADTFDFEVADEQFTTREVAEPDFLRNCDDAHVYGNLGPLGSGAVGGFDPLRARDDLDAYIAEPVDVWGLLETMQNGETCGV